MNRNPASAGPYRSPPSAFDDAMDERASRGVRVPILSLSPVAPSPQGARRLMAVSASAGGRGLGEGGVERTALPPLGTALAREGFVVDAEYDAVEVGLRAGAGSGAGSGSGEGGAGLGAFAGEEGGAWPAGTGSGLASGASTPLSPWQPRDGGAYGAASSPSGAQGDSGVLFASRQALAGEEGYGHRRAPSKGRRKKRQGAVGGSRKQRRAKRVAEEHLAQAAAAYGAPWQDLFTLEGVAGHNLADPVR
jgi:hypothetical protein